MNKCKNDQKCANPASSIRFRKRLLWPRWDKRRETAQKKGFDVWWEEGRINERRRERADCRTARCSSFKNDATVFLLSSLHLATLVDRGWPSEAVDKRGGDPPLPSGKVPKAKQNGPTTTGMQKVTCLHFQNASTGPALTFHEIRSWALIWISLIRYLS